MRGLRGDRAASRAAARRGSCSSTAGRRPSHTVNPTTTQPSQEKADRLPPSSALSSLLQIKRGPRHRGRRVVADGGRRLPNARPPAAYTACSSDHDTPCPQGDHASPVLVLKLTGWAQSRARQDVRLLGRRSPVPWSQRTVRAPACRRSLAPPRACTPLLEPFTCPSPPRTTGARPPKRASSLFWRAAWLTASADP